MEELNAPADLFARHDTLPLEKRCKVCPSTTPSCPSCDSGKVCVQVSQTCTECAYRYCSANSTVSGATTVATTPAGPNVGAIAGGVVGGVVVIAMVTYLLWRFFLRIKAEEWEEDFEEEFADASEKDASGGSGNVGNGESGDAVTLRTRNSFASTAFTRASNVIPIAFIPGIIDRSGHTQDLVPPVPIPTHQQSMSPYSDHHGDTYFMPGDLRDSTYSGFSDDGASSIAGRSITTSLLRGSMASTVYPTVLTAAPAQTAQRARAAVVSVKHSGATTPIPAVPRVDHERYAQGGSASGPTSASAGANTNISAMVTPLITLNAVAYTHNSTAATVSSPLALHSASVTSPSSSPLVPSSPTTAGRSQQRRSTTKAGQANLTAVIEQATRRASRQPTHGGLGSLNVVQRRETERESSPFGDEHAVEEVDL